MINHAAFSHSVNEEITVNIFFKEKTNYKHQKKIFPL